MGKSNGNSWLNVVRNAFKSPTKVDREENDQEVDNKRGKRRWVFLKNCAQETTIQHNVCKARTTEGNLVAKHARVESSVLEQRCVVAMASTAAAEAAVATARAAVDILSLNTFASPQFVNLHRAALVIQTMFRGYLARRALMALKGIVKLQALIRAHIVRKRAKMTLQCIQSLVRVQAHVCDQRRRRSCEATSLGSLFTANYRRKSLSKNVSSSSDYHPRAVEEIQALVQKARECSFKQGKKTLGHVLSQQIWKVDEDQFSDNSYPEFEGGNRYKNRNLNNLVSVDSPKTPSSTKTERRNYQSAETPTLRSIYHHRMSMSESSYPLPRPHYMAATASAMARVRPHSTPRHRPSSPNRELTGCSSAKKRLSFPIPDTNPHNADDKANNRRIYSAKKHHDVPCYLTE